MKHQLFCALRVAVFSAIGLAVLAVSGLAPRTVHADPSGFQVFGYVKYSSGQPISGARVYVLCIGQGKYADNFTDANGYYAVIMNTLSCPVGGVIKVKAYTNNFSLLGDGSGTRSGDSIRIDVVSGGTIPVPEYGWLAGILATGAGISAITIIRRLYRQSISQ